MSARLTRRFCSRLRKTVKRWQHDDGNLLVSSLAYYAVFSVFPLLLLLISVLGLVLSLSSNAQDAQQHLLEMLAQNTSDTLAGQVKTALTEIRTKAIISGPVGLAVLLFGAIGIFAHVDKAFDRIWNDKTRGSSGPLTMVRNVLFYRARAFLMLIALSLLVLAAFFATMAASTLQQRAALLPGGSVGWNLVQIPASMAFNWLLFSTIYKVLPKRRVQWSHALRGGLLAAVLWEIVRQILTLAVVGRKYSAYGIVGSLIALMVWIYVAISVLFFGAEFVRVVSDEADEQTG